MSFALKKQLKKELLNVGWAGKVDEAAVGTLAQLIEERYGGQLDDLLQLLRACVAEGATDGRITAESVHRVATQASNVQQVEVLELVQAFDVPRLSFDPVQRKLLLDTKPRTLHATAEFKTRLYQDRLALIQQRLQRNRLFQQNDLILATSHRGHTAQLSDVQSLKGVFGVTCYVLGCISRAEDGRYVLEDASGSVPLNLNNAETAAGFYTENCIVIAEGVLHQDGVLHVRALGLPPTEPRAALPLAGQRLNLFGGGELAPEALLALQQEEVSRAASGEERIVVLANVWLDQAQVIDSLEFVFKTFSSVVTLPAVFVLMGNFHSRAGSSSGSGGGGRGASAAEGGGVDFATMRQLFCQLAELIDQYPRLKAESRFIFMPGPDDPGPAPTLPQPPLPAALTGDLRRALPNALFASNPCRLRFCTRQLVLFRHDLLKWLRRRAILPLSDAGGADASSSLWGHLALTLLQQSHLAPLPLLQQPIYWQHDAALQLYPLPHALLLADCSAAQDDFTHEGCRVVNPGAFPNGFFAAYLPISGQLEMSELPKPGAQGTQMEDVEVEVVVEEEVDAGLQQLRAEAGDDGMDDDDGDGDEALLDGPLQRLREQQGQQQQRGQRRVAGAVASLEEGEADEDGDGDEEVGDGDGGARDQRAGGAARAGAKRRPAGEAERAIAGGALVGAGGVDVSWMDRDDELFE